MIFISDIIKLYIPKLEELEYRQAILMQSETMIYNKVYDSNISTYHKDTGCIEFPRSRWEKWYKFWIDNKPSTYYAYIFNTTDNQFIGEVNLHYNSERDWYDMGIIIESKYRGKGFGKQALILLLDIAFKEYNAKAVHNDFENTRDTAYKLHLSVGFKVVNSENGMIDLLIKKNDLKGAYLY